MKATAEIIDLANYRQAKQRAKAASSEPMSMMPQMMVGWMPVWVLVPVPVAGMAASE